MKNILSLSLLAVLASCGNPHIGSKNGPDELPYNPIQMECEAAASEFTHINFFSGTHPYNVPVEFSALTKCKNSIMETFNSFAPGKTYMLTNEARESHSYELFHLGARDVAGDKARSLEDFFGTETFAMLVEPKISQDGITGVDQGVDSLKSDKATLETLLWNYASPISLWGAKVVDLEAGSTLRLFDCDQNLIKEIKVKYPEGQSGESSLHFIGVNSNKADICHVSLTSVDSDSLAVDEFSYGF